MAAVAGCCCRTQLLDDGCSALSDVVSVDGVVSNLVGLSVVAVVVIRALRRLLQLCPC